MKVAFCFSGQIRHLDECISYWKPIILSYNADVFGSFWETDDQTKDKFEAEFTPKIVQYENFDLFKKTTLDIFIQELNPPVFIGPLGLSAETGDYVKQGNILSMFYQIWKSNLLASSEHYDVVVRLRTDIFLSHFSIEKNQFLNLPHGSIGVWSWENCYGPVDLIAFGSQEIMNFYSCLFLYLTRFLKEGEFFFPPENLLRVHLAQKDTQIRTWIGFVYFFRNAFLLKADEPHVGSHNISFAEERIFSSKEWIISKEKNPLFNFWKPFDS